MAQISWDDEQTPSASVEWDQLTRPSLGAPEELSFGERAATFLNELTGGSLGRGLDVVSPAARGFVQGAADPVVGAVQLGANVIGQGDQINQAIRENEAKQEDLGTSGVARFVGNVASPANLMIASRLPAAGSLFKQGAAVGALGGAIQPVTDQNFAAEKIKQTILGGALGGVGGAVLGTAASALNPRVSPAATKLMQEGVEVTPGQAAGGLWQRLEDKLVSAPFIGGSIAEARRRGIESFNKAALNRALAPIGESTDEVGREGFKQVKTKIGDAYDKILPQLNVSVDNQFMQDMGNLRSMAQNMPEAQAKQFDKLLDNLALSRFTPAGLMSGETMKRVESELGKKASNYLRDQSADMRDLGSALQEAQNVLRQLVVRSNPSKAGELQKINEAYANYARLRRASSALGAEEGVFTPSQLLNAVKAEDRTVGKAGFAQGNALLQDLAEAGKTTLGQKVPNSGTADRLSAFDILSLAKGAAGSIPAAALYSRPVSQFIARSVTNPRTARQIRIADLIRQAGPAGLLGVSGASQ